MSHVLAFVLGFVACPISVILYGLFDNWRRPNHLAQAAQIDARRVVAQAAEAQGVHLRAYP